MHLDPASLTVLASKVTCSYANRPHCAPSPPGVHSFAHLHAFTRGPAVKEFATAQIRNVALVAHHGVGKTSLAEAMLFNAKATTRLGRISDGNTLLDYAADEIQRQITI